jgi:hypothetical protein
MKTFREDLMGRVQKLTSRTFERYCSLYLCRYLHRPRCSWEDWIRMDLRETGFGGVDWI